MRLSEPKLELAQSFASVSILSNNQLFFMFCNTLFLQYKKTPSHCLKSFLTF